MLKTRDAPYRLLTVVLAAVALAILPAVLWAQRGGGGWGGRSGGYEGRSSGGGGWQGHSGGSWGGQTGGSWQGRSGGSSGVQSSGGRSQGGWWSHGVMPSNPNQSSGSGSGYGRRTWSNTAPSGNSGMRSGQGWSGGRDYGRRTVQPDSSRVGTASPGVSARSGFGYRSGGGGVYGRGPMDRGGGSSTFGRGAWQGRSPESRFGGRFEGRGFGREEREFHHPRFSAGFFFYDFVGFTDPFFYGYWDFGYPLYGPAYYSPFFYYGFPYVYGPRVVIIAPPVYVYYDVPTAYWSDYYLSPGYRSGLTEALDDIRDAWITGRGDLMVRHIDKDTKVSVYVDGKYSYSLPGTDYENMTRDAIDHIQTIDFTIYKVSKRSDGAYAAFAKHEFEDADNGRKTVYVSYSLLKIDDRWIIVSAGSSESKLK